jgi:hypothetical protein
MSSDQLLNQGVHNDKLGAANVHDIMNHLPLEFDDALLHIAPLLKMSNNDCQV